jgi:hypothetical protein
MKQIKHFITALLMPCLVSFNLSAQQGNVAAGGDATGTGGTMSYSIGQTDYLMYSSTQGSLSLGLQQPLLQSLPFVLEVPNTTIFGGQAFCFNAEQTVIVAGDGKHFIVEAEGHADIIAGHNILLKHGTRVELSGSLYARISNIWCPPQHGMLAALYEPVQIKALFEPEFTTNFFKVYPNPTTGDFMLELLEFEETSSLLIDIFSIQGHLIMSNELPTKQRYTFSLTGKQPGIYIIRVMNNHNIGTSRIIKQ